MKRFAANCVATQFVTVASGAALINSDSTDWSSRIPHHRRISRDGLFFEDTEVKSGSTWNLLTRWII